MQVTTQWQLNGMLLVLPMLTRSGMQPFLSHHKERLATGDQQPAWLTTCLLCGHELQRRHACFAAMSSSHDMLLCGHELQPGPEGLLAEQLLLLHKAG
jgi:hypothetical protein